MIHFMEERLCNNKVCQISSETRKMKYSHAPYFPYGQCHPWPTSLVKNSTKSWSVWTCWSARAACCFQCRISNDCFEMQRITFHVARRTGNEILFASTRCSKCRLEAIVTVSAFGRTWKLRLPPQKGVIVQNYIVVRMIRPRMPQYANVFELDILMNQSKLV